MVGFRPPHNTGTSFHQPHPSSLSRHLAELPAPAGDKTRLLAGAGSSTHQHQHPAVQSLHRPSMSEHPCTQTEREPTQQQLKQNQALFLSNLCCLQSPSSTALQGQHVEASVTQNLSPAQIYSKSETVSHTARCWVLLGAERMD